MEKLLNKLIDKGWKPFGDENVKEIRIYSEMDMECIYWKRKSDFYNFSLRKLVSKESWLWKFVCKNGMIKEEWNSEWTIIYPNERTGDYQKCHSYCKWQSEYWILESSLKDESELEDFLLNSIKLD